MELNNLKDRKVTVMGLGLHGGGVGVAKFLEEKGAKVLVTDLKTESELESSVGKLKKNKNIKLILGKHRSEDFINTDLVVKNPAVPESSRYLQIARDNNVSIETEITLFFRFCPAKIFGVTGSKGKSTVSSLLTELLKSKYKDIILAGNIGKSALAQLEKINRKTVVVLELSSWQLHELKDLKQSPHLAVVTNILPDHLNKYESLEDYIEDKKQIFKWQKSGDYLILNYDKPVVGDFYKEAGSKVFFYSRDNFPESSDDFNRGAFIKEGKIFYDSEQDPVCELDQIKLKGVHNLDNILAAVTAAKICRINNRKIVKVLSEFSGVEGRLKKVLEIEGVEYINDTTATIPEAAMAALETVSDDHKKNVVIITGGTDKELEFDEFAEALIKKTKAVILLEGSATKKIKEQLSRKQKSFDGLVMPQVLGPFDNMKKAVSEASSLVEAGDKVLLSPACASFELFRHEFERGEAFKEAVFETAKNK